MTAAKSGSGPLRLAYVGDVPIEQTIGGSVALWRLLEAYPAHALLVIEGRTSSAPSLRLPGVRYERLSPGLWRLARTRFWRIVMPLVLASARARARTLERSMADFSPEAVLTVTHGASWLTAAELASRRGVPLYLINHDCWFETFDVPRLQRGRLEREFGAVYRQAKARFCVSREMAEYYQRHYGADGIVLYPPRARSAPRFGDWPGAHRDSVFTLAYAGGIYGGCADLLAHAAEALARLGGKLAVYSDLAPGSAVRTRLVHAGIEWRAFVLADGFIEALRSGADALLVVREREMGENARLSFPSKLVDYSATGLPIVLCAPGDSAAAAWVRAAGEVALLVEPDDSVSLTAAIHRLARDAALRKELGEAALEAGESAFSHESVSRRFLAALEGSGMR